MCLCIFLKKQYLPFLSNIETSTLPLGIGKIIGNKGGIILSFSIAKKSFCFLSCHLAARPGQELLRRENYHDLIRNLKLANK